MLIVIEGTDASGKATQSRIVQEKLGGPGKCALYSFPRYGTTLGAAILRHLKREVALVEILKEGGCASASEDALMFQCMMTIDKYHAAREIREHVLEGRHVVCDRWRQSAEIYGASDGLDPRWLSEIHDCLPSIGKTLNIYLHVSDKIALGRRPGLRDRYEQDRGKQNDLRGRYMQMWTREAVRDPLSWVIVDGEMSVERVTSEILSAVAKLM